MRTPSSFRHNGTPLTIAHEEFEELCALSIVGELTKEDRHKLEEHINTCLDCRETREQFAVLVDRVVPAFAAEEFKAGGTPSEGDWSQESAEEKLFLRLLSEEHSHGNGIARANPRPVDGLQLFPSATWRNVRTLYAAGSLLFIGLAIFSYRLGVDRGRDITNLAVPTQSDRKVFTPPHSPLEEHLSDAGHNHEVAPAEIVRRDGIIARLKNRLLRQSSQIYEINAAQNRLQNTLQAEEAARQGLDEQRADLARRLELAETTSTALQQKVDALVQQSARDADSSKASETRVSELRRRLRDRDAELQQRDEFLAHDRDIRELIGARDLYIAEVYDVARTGETKKPYGRVFYTKGTSLIFYAYDLDRQPGLKTASTFQAWGRRGPDRQQAVNLGIFYEDNASKKRWVLKCDDAKTLDQIDAVFVTVEPDGGSHKPSSKLLLFASLKTSPNHP